MLNLYVNFPLKVSSVNCISERKAVQCSRLILSQLHKGFSIAIAFEGAIPFIAAIPTTYLIKQFVYRRSKLPGNLLGSFHVLLTPFFARAKREESCPRPLITPVFASVTPKPHRKQLGGCSGRALQEFLV